MGGKQGLAFVIDALGLVSALFCYVFSFSLSNLVVWGEIRKEDSFLKRQNMGKSNNNVKSSEFSKVMSILALAWEKIRSSLKSNLNPGFL